MMKLTIGKNLKRLRREKILHRINSQIFWVCRINLFPDGKPGYHLDKDTTPFPR